MNTDVPELPLQDWTNQLISKSIAGNNIGVNEIANIFSAAWEKAGKEQ